MCEVHFSLDLMPINMVFPQCILSTFGFLKAKCFWFGCLFDGEVSFSVWTLDLKNSFMVNNATRRSTKNSRGMKPDPSTFTVFPVRSVLNHHCTAFTLDKSYSPRRRFRSEGVSLFLPWGENQSHPNKHIKHGEVSFQVSARNDSSATKNMNVSTTLSR